MTKKNDWKQPLKDMNIHKCMKPCSYKKKKKNEILC